MNPKFTLSIVSHGHKEYICQLLNDLSRLERADFDVILTLNLRENIEIDYSVLPYSIQIIHNQYPKGFAENHNAAFLVSKGDNFVILNPDIKFVDDPFIILSSIISASPNSIFAPSIINYSGELEDSARNFPTPVFLVKKLVATMLKIKLKNDVVPETAELLSPDWVAGMFVLIPRHVYKELNGLSEKYHMYYEDVDFCARANLAGYKILISKKAKVIHEAQRDSHRKLRYLLWHLHSAIKFFTSRAYLKIHTQRLFKK
ncbi:glycosyltransferase like family protein [Collimonas fungivorans]|uniref:Glycosyltransferase like family protein n=1 Tax=Collimonas fungivorans TaxID=158899 RepID=A0A127P810_9BURK|nr:glycosyltransferase family 2 protein [Collimonas fungivorans]AMO93795.1 glycosyltransferase like family protein [Collimonas fungivorans]